MVLNYLISFVLFVFGLLCIFKTIDVIRFYKKYTKHNSFFNEITRKKWFNRSLKICGIVTVFFAVFMFFLLLNKSAAD